MANLPLRNLGGAGVITDINTYDLPPNAFTDANNVIFDDISIQRAPVFKKLYSAIKSAITYEQATGDYDSNTNQYENAEGGSVNTSRFVGSYSDPQTGETVFVCDRDGTVRSYPNGSLGFSTPTVGTLVANDNHWTHAQVAGMSILARKGMVPYIRNIKDDSKYSHMGNDWGTTDYAGIVRGYNDFIVMLDMEKAGKKFPTMVKWSNPVPYGAASNTIQWDAGNTTYVAGETVLGELKSEIRDGMTMGSVFVIYAQDQVWLMEYNGGTFVFSFRKLFPDGGIINTNCAVEIEGKHYVFGEDDIYMHDGVSKGSIVDAKIRRRIYNDFDRDKQKTAFVLHDSVSNLILFCYSTKHSGAHWKNTQFANKAAVFNYRNNSWSFMDLPNVAGGAEVNVPGIKPKLPVMLGISDTANKLTESRILAVDLPEGMLVNLPVAADTVTPCYVERTGLDIDDMGGLPLRSYKTVTCIVPQMDAKVPIKFEVGSSDIPTQAGIYRDTRTFNSATDYKVDTKVSGRYLSYKITLDTTDNFKLSGMDIEVVATGRR